MTEGLRRAAAFQKKLQQEKISLFSLYSLPLSLSLSLSLALSLSFDASMTYILIVSCLYRIPTKPQISRDLSRVTHSLCTCSSHGVCLICVGIYSMSLWMGKRMVPLTVLSAAKRTKVLEDHLLPSAHNL